MSGLGLSDEMTMAWSKFGRRKTKLFPSAKAGEEPITNLQQRKLLDDLNLAADTALAIDGIASGFGGHSGAEPELAGAFNFADLMRVMHGSKTFLILIYRNHQRFIR